MPVETTCPASRCTKACLVPRIIEHIKKQGFLPTLLSPCMYNQGAPYWMWTNRYQGDLVVVDLDVKYPHVVTIWEVSIFFDYNAQCDAHGTQKPAVHIPVDIVVEVVGWLDSGSDISNAALVQRSWCYPTQVRLFGAVTLRCPVRTQLFVEAFVRNIGPGNPRWRMGMDRLRLECFVRHIYIDVPENYSQVRFYANITTILPLLRNLRSLYVMMRRWNDHVWQIELGKYLPEHAPPSLERLCIQASIYCN